MQLSERPIKSLKNIEGIQIHLKYENRRFPLLIELFRIDLKIQLSELLSRGCDVFQFQKYSRVEEGIISAIVKANIFIKWDFQLY